MQEAGPDSAIPCERIPLPSLWDSFLPEATVSDFPALRGRIPGDDRPKQFCAVVGNETLLAADPTPGFTVGFCGGGQCWMLTKTARTFLCRLR